MKEVKEIRIDYEAIEYVAFIMEEPDIVNLSFIEREKKFQEWRKKLEIYNIEL